MNDLATAAYAQCFPGSSWIKVVTTDDGDTFIDADRMEVREGNQVSFWTMIEVFNDRYDFLVVRLLVDCDRRLSAVLETASVVTGRYGESESAQFQWQSPLPYSQAEGVLDSACRYRTAALKPGSPTPKGNRPKAAKSPPKKKPVGLEI